jgi:hypothetical protein
MGLPIRAASTRSRIEVTPIQKPAATTNVTNTSTNATAPNTITDVFLFISSSPLILEARWTIHHRMDLMAFLSTVGAYQVKNALFVVDNQDSGA